MTQANRIISKFGGLTATARALSSALSRNGDVAVIPITTVQGWKRGEGLIPSRWHMPLVQAGVLLDIDIGPRDFFDFPDRGTP